MKDFFWNEIDEEQYMTFKLQADQYFPNRDLSLRVLVGVKRVPSGSTGPAPADSPGHPPASLSSAPQWAFLQREAKFSKTRKSEKKTIVLAADVCSVAKIQVPVSQKKSIVFTADVCSVGKKRAKRAQTSYQKFKNGQKSGTDGAYVPYEK